MRADVVIVGAGPTSVFAYELLRRCGVETVLVGDFADASIMPVESPYGPITLIPVFPTLPAPTYPPSTPTEEALTVSRSGSSSWIEAESVTASSLVDMLLPDRDACAMAVKQYGARALSDPMTQVQEKIKRAYTGPPIRRAGYIDGLSPYLGPMLEILAERGPGPSAVQTWKPGEKLIELSGPEARLKYDKLLYVSGLKRLTETLGVPAVIPSRAAAYFSTYATDTPLVPNQVAYDLARTSPVMRAFVASEHVVVVQESLVHARDAASTRSTADVLGVLFGAHLVPFGERLAYHSAYPLERMDAAAEATLDDTCTELDIMRFGRNAAERYLDLHELDWEGLRSWSLS